jgi:opacity protein-like surface antigen
MPIPRRSFRAFLCILSAVLLIAGAAQARALGPKGDAFLGYSRTGSDIFYPNTGALNGWEGALHVRTMPFLGVEGDVAHYGLGADTSVPRTTTYLFGPRATIGTLGIKVFAHGLIGGEHSANDNGISGNAFAYALGGGLDLRVAPFFSWRFAGDRLSAPSQSPNFGTQARFSTGIVFRF